MNACSSSTGITANHQRVKPHPQQARPRTAAEPRIGTDEPRRLHHRFETTPRTQAQIDRRDKDKTLAHAGIEKAHPPPHHTAALL
ncbi:hypothetical protein [Streptomyces sp. NPDC001292]|uniref:hypothetical protein n=1 Tax=Streptomyces sp. NPDC001292 TaxID=3364558 RepID=UPI0036BAE099